MQMDLELHHHDMRRLLPVIPARPAMARPEFQVVNKYRLPDGSIKVPMDLAYTMVDDRLYMLGDKWFEGGSWNSKSTGSSNISGVINIDRKIYVLAKTFNGVVEEHWSPLFEVFYPDIGTWRVLPNIPSIGGCTRLPRDSFHGLMCLVYHGLGPKEESYTSEDEDTDGDDGAGGRPESASPVMSVRVVLFLLSVSDNLVLFASVEVVETYELKQHNCPRMCSPVIKRGDLAKHGRGFGDRGCL
ncbi:hypothetical protein ACFX15_038315 [Malus domestica]